MKLWTCLGATAFRARAVPCLWFRAAFDCVLCAVEIFEVEPNEDALQCVSATADHSSHLCVTHVVAIHLEPFNLLIRKRNSLWQSSLRVMCHPVFEAITRYVKEQRKLCN